MTVYEKIHSMSKTELAIYLLKRDIACFADAARQLNEQNIVVNLLHNPAKSIFTLLRYLKQDESEI